MKENKQYKLKRWYPSLDERLEVGDIGDRYLFEFINGTKEERFSVFKGGRLIYIPIRELHPDFWELIEEEKPKPIWSDYYLNKYRWYRKCRKQTWYKHQFTNDALELSITFTGTWWALYGKINRYSDVVDTEVW